MEFGSECVVDRSVFLTFHKQTRPEVQTKLIENRYPLRTMYGSVGQDRQHQPSKMEIFEKEQTLHRVVPILRQHSDSEIDIKRKKQIKWMVQDRKRQCSEVHFDSDSSSSSSDSFEIVINPLEEKNSFPRRLTPEEKEYLYQTRPDLEITPPITIQDLVLMRQQRQRNFAWSVVTSLVLIVMLTVLYFIATKVDPE